jgi:hypothetical protein
MLVAMVSVATASETRQFTLYKWQQRIGTEEVFITRDVRGTEIRSAFAFTDRSTPVPLAATLRLAPEGTPQSFQIWGSTSRPTRIDDRVVVSGKTVTITQRGMTRAVPAPPRFFLASAYAPVVITEELLRYWSTHGSPARLPVFPVGEVTIERRGEDVIADNDGKSRKLTRYSIGGLQWGHESVWLDEQGNIAAQKGVDAEFDHFEATARGFSEALSKLVARAAEDGMASLAETSARLREGATDGRIAYVGVRLIDGTGAPPVPDAVVVTDGDRIVAAGPSAKVAVPAGARVVDVAGKTMLPGLWDMHAHFEQVEWGPLYLAAGVTTVRDCGNEVDFIRAVRDAIAGGRGIGPRILLACLVDGEGPAAIGKIRMRSSDQIPDIIAEFERAGCRQVKIYSSLDPKLIAPLAQAAHTAGMTVTGHVPEGIGAVAAIEAGMDQINHSQFVTRAFLAPGTDPAKRLTPFERKKAFSELDLDSPASKHVAATFVEKKTVLDPTLALSELFSTPHDELVKHEPGLAKLPPAIAGAYADVGVRPEDAERLKKEFDTALALIGMLHKLGVPVVTGTDQAVPGTARRAKSSCTSRPAFRDGGDPSRHHCSGASDEARQGGGHDRGGQARRSDPG